MKRREPAFSDCQLIGVNPIMLFLHSIVAQEYADLDEDWTVTSGTRRRGRTKSKHPDGLALDYRTKHLTKAKREQILRNVRARVKGFFDFIWEDEIPGVRGEHFHGEYDPKP